jgi:uncharacterized protein (TIGR02246 family)
MQPRHARVCRIAGVLLSLAILLNGTCSAAAPQKDKKKKKDATASAAEKPITLMPEEQQIDYMISTMLGAWQTEDVERLHECYADDATFVSGIWAPLVVGWANYLPLYKQQRARVTQVRMDRTNTYIRVEGTLAWASYQWDFSGTVDDQTMVSQGQTTLVMEKRNNRWLIIHNHTSVAQLPQQLPSPAGNTPAATQPAANKPPSR